MNIAVFGCKSTTKYLLENLENVKINHLITVSKEKSRKIDIADYFDLERTAKNLDIDVYHCKKYSLKNEYDIEFINSLDIDIAFVIGWQRLIPGEILDSVRAGVFGMHGSSMNLPFGRGRSPMNWSIIEDRKYFYTNLFMYDSGIDSGDILDTVKFSISNKDTSETMHYKNTLSMKYLIEKNIKKLESAGDLSLKKQLPFNPTYYPKRMPMDSLIDWREDIHSIERFVRAVTKPFNGAFTFIDDIKLTIYSAQILCMVEFGFEEKKIGEIVALFESGKFIVKCIDGLLLVNEYDLSNLQNSLIEKGKILKSRNIRKFTLNEFGKYDLEGEK